MNILLKSRFTYLLNGLNYQNPLNSFDDIMKNQIRIGSTPDMIPAFNTTPEISNYIEKFHLLCDPGPNCLRRSAFQRDIAILKPVRKGRAFVKALIENNGSFLLHEIKPPFSIIPIAIHFQRGHPLFPIFNKHLFNLVEMGIAKKIISKYDPKIKMAQQIYTEQRALKMEHLVIPLVLWMAGILCASIVFTIERIVKLKFDIHQENAVQK
ncbi:hypothetical protein HHI36_014350 [Cryptolaemus montrouzieri]|uniref:Uncharacterized protein n=1 Tax=Cryptolaemus montrouzieri TaxID=559131 RepID=A0ABD2N2L7_9CUCU